MTTKTEEGVTITIRNDGEGISDEEQGHLFEPYYRTPTAQASSVGGLGIGLFISKQIIEAHKGTVVLISKRGEGATIVATLPRATLLSTEVTHTKNQPIVTTE